MTRRNLIGLSGVRGTVVMGALLTVLVIGCTFLLDPYRNFQLATAAAFFCTVSGLTVLIGFSGQLSLGQAALMAAGGYGYALAENALHEMGVDGVLRFALSMLAGITAAGGIGLLLGLAAARLRGPYLAGLTLAIAVAIPAVTTFWSGIFRGDQGLRTAYESVPPLLATLIAVEQWQAWVAILVAGVVVTGLAVFSRSAVGLQMRAVRDDETAARLSGISPPRVKVTAFLASAITAGAGGAMACYVTHAVSPGAYTLAFSLLLVVAAVIGGLGSIGGAAVGSALIVVVPWLLDSATDLLPSDVAQRLAGNLPVLVFGALLIVVMIVAPAGVQTLFRRRHARKTKAPLAQAANPESADPQRSIPAPSLTNK